jgi:hypothetical protein
MDFKRLAQKALRTGVKQGIGYMRRSGRDTTALKVVDSLLGDSGGRESTAKRGPQPGPRTKAKPAAGPAPASGAGSGEAVRSGLAHARSAPRSKPAQGFPKRPDGGYPGDYTGPVKPVYAPDLDGKADPGEIVWAWVPYEEDHSQGKDRPVLVIGHDGRWLLALMLTSKDNVPGGVGEVHEDDHGRYINVGSGDWDPQGRASEIRLDRVIRIEPGAVRREGAIMPMERFARVVESVG